MFGRLLTGLALLLLPIYGFAENLDSSPALITPLTAEKLQSALVQFRRNCQAHPAVEVPRPKKGDIEFVPPGALVPNQITINFNYVLRKFQRSLEIENTTAANYIMTGRWTFPNDKEHGNGRSFYALDKALRVVYYGGRVYVANGHNRAIVSIVMNSWVPVEYAEVIPDEVEPDEAEKIMAKKGYSFLFDKWGEPHVRVDFCSMEHDSNLELARALFANVDVEFNKGNLEIEKVRGSEWVAGVKVDDSVDFGEVLTAIALRKGGQIWGDNRLLTKKDVAESIPILRAAQKNGSPLARRLVFKEPVALDKIKSDQLPTIAEYLQSLKCESKLRDRRKKKD